MSCLGNKNGVGFSKDQFLDHDSNDGLEGIYDMGDNLHTRVQTHGPTRPKRMRHPPIVTQLSGDSSNEGEHDGSIDDVHDDVHTTHVNGIKYLCRNKTWFEAYCTYTLAPREFLERMESFQIFREICNVLQLWSLFWSHKALGKIMAQTNHYTIHMLVMVGAPWGGDKIESL